MTGATGRDMYGGDARRQLVGPPFQLESCQTVQPAEGDPSAVEARASAARKRASDADERASTADERARRLEGQLRKLGVEPVA